MADFRADFAAVFAAFEEIGRQINAAISKPLTQDDVVLVPAPLVKETTMYAPGGVLAPPITDPTRGRAPRRTEAPRLLVRSIDGYRINLPASDHRNRAGIRGPRLFIATWGVWLLDEHGREHLLEPHDTGSGALHALPRLLHEVGLLDEHAHRPAEGGGHGAA